MRRPACTFRLPGLLAGAWVVLAMTGCGRSRPIPLATPEPVITYEVRGVLREALPDIHRARISHEAIDGYMGAMTMEFDVADPAALAELHAGDPIAFRLSVTEKRGWIDRLHRIDERPVVPAAPEIAAAPVALPTSVPDCALTDETGRPFHLADYAGEPLAITFIFTRCPFPSFCPLLSARFVEAQRALPTDRPWHLLSISLDPEYDTPARLTEYAARFPRDPKRWSFATGARAEIRTLGAVVGLAVTDSAGLPEHNLRTVVIDPQGRVQKIFPGNEWTAGELAAELTRAVAGTP